MDKKRSFDHLPCYIYPITFERIKQCIEQYCKGPTCHRSGTFKIFEAEVFDEGFFILTPTWQRTGRMFVLNQLFNPAQHIVIG